MLKCCITGGPGAGKSSIMSVLTQVLAERGYKTLICPETASELILNGICPGENISMEKFQELILDKQLLKESIYDTAAECFDQSKLVILYDRGLHDQMAYISKEKFEKLLNKRNHTLTDALAHYDCVFHLVTAADGAPDYYVWNDPTKNDVGNNAARRESPLEAIEKDKLTLNAWIGHPHLRVFDNSTNFAGKVNRVVKELFSVLGEPEPKEIERKFLIEKPSDEAILSLGCISKSNIIQTYLKKTSSETERRVRQRGTTKEGFSFYYTEKTNISNGERVEIEDKISPAEYINYLSEADTSLHQISKTRYCFIYKNKYYEMDIYPFSDKYAILEIELNDINEEIELPNLTIIKEVTNDDRYKNHSLAKNLSLEFEDIKDEPLKKFKEKAWTYEVGREEPEILGSGSTFYNVETTTDEVEAFELLKKAARNYLIRYKKINGIKIIEYYEPYQKIWTR